MCYVRTQRNIVGLQNELNNRRMKMEMQDLTRKAVFFIFSSAGSAGEMEIVDINNGRVIMVDRDSMDLFTLTKHENTD